MFLILLFGMLMVSMQLLVSREDPNMKEKISSTQATPRNRLQACVMFFRCYVSGATDGESLGNLY